MANSDDPKPTVAAHFDDPSMQGKPIPAEEMAAYFVSMLREDRADSITRAMVADGYVVDEVLCTLAGALAGFIASVYADDEERACSTWGHLSVFGHALTHQLIHIDDEDGDADESVSSS